MARFHGVLHAWLAAASLGAVVAFPDFISAIPNGGRVRFRGQPAPGVGHTSTSGGGPRNQFGLDFMAQGKTWTKVLCEMDSDGDGQSNGLELGDPACIWAAGAVPQRTTDISHPGFAESVTAAAAPTAASASSSTASTTAAAAAATTSAATSTPLASTSPSTTTPTPTTMTTTSTAAPTTTSAATTTTSAAASASTAAAPAPAVQFNSWVSLRASSGKFVGVVGGRLDAAFDDAAADQCHFLLESLDGRGDVESGSTVFLTVFTGNRVTIQGAHATMPFSMPNVVHAYWDHMGSWQSLTVTRPGGGTLRYGDALSFRGHLGRFIAVDGSTLSAFRDGFDASMAFTVEPVVKAGVSAPLSTPSRRMYS